VRRRLATTAAVLALALVLACGGIGIRRDLSAVPIGRVGYRDLCGLQRYFDRLETHRAEAPRLVLSVGAEERRATASGGRDQWAFESRLARRTLRRVLQANWTNLPPGLGRARRVRLDVEWVDRAGIRRVVTGKPAELVVAGESHDLPYHPCLSELLYGAALYRQRRETLGLPGPAGDPWGLGASPDGGAAPDAGP